MKTLDNQLLNDVISHWSYFDNGPLTSSIERSSVQIPDLSSKLALVIQGVRHCGKSTLLFQIMKKKQLDPKAAFFVNFEDPRLASYLSYELLEAIYQFALSRPGVESRGITFFLMKFKM